MYRPYNYFDDEITSDSELFNLGEDYFRSLSTPILFTLQQLDQDIENYESGDLDLVHINLERFDFKNLSTLLDLFPEMDESQFQDFIAFLENTDPYGYNVLEKASQNDFKLDLS